MLGIASKLWACGNTPQFRKWCAQSHSQRSTIASGDRSWSRSSSTLTKRRSSKQYLVRTQMGFRQARQGVGRQSPLRGCLIRYVVERCTRLRVALHVRQLELGRFRMHRTEETVVDCSPLVYRIVLFISSSPNTSPPCSKIGCRATCLGPWGMGGKLCFRLSMTLHFKNVQPAGQRPTAKLLTTKARTTT
jgi:hypothetical protein